MFAIAHLELSIASVFPRVENPWPESIGIGFPFALAGAGGVLASVIFAEASEEERDQAIRSLGLAAFRAGAAFYLASLVVQVASML